MPTEYQDKKLASVKNHWEECGDFQMDEEYGISVYLERFEKGAPFTLRFVTGHGLEATIAPIPEKVLKRMLNFLQDSVQRESYTE